MLFDDAYIWHLKKSLIGNHAALTIFFTLELERPINEAFFMASINLYLFEFLCIFEETNRN